MPVFSKSLLRQDNLSRQEKFQVMQLRRARLIEVGKNVIEGLGYKIGGSLRQPGGHAFAAKLDGKDTRIGMKTSSDRWLGLSKDVDGGFGLLGKVDLLFVVAFDRWPEPEAIQVYEFDAKDILERAEGVYAEAKKLGHTGLQFLPLDAISDRRPAMTKFGNLAKLGKIVFEENITWSDAENETVEEDHVEGRAQSVTELPIMERIKMMLSEHMGVRPELIEVDVRVKF